MVVTLRRDGVMVYILYLCKFNLLAIPILETQNPILNLRVFLYFGIPLLEFQEFNQNKIYRILETKRNLKNLLVYLEFLEFL